MVYGLINDYLDFINQSSSCTKVLYPQCPELWGILRWQVSRQDEICTLSSYLSRVHLHDLIFVAWAPIIFWLFHIIFIRRNIPLSTLKVQSIWYRHHSKYDQNIIWRPFITLSFYIGRTLNLKLKGSSICLLFALTLPLTNNCNI